MRRTTLDDDVTTGGIRLFLRLYEATGEQRYREAAERGVTFLLASQLPSGAWPLVWRPWWKRAVWPIFEDLAALNDGATTDAIATLLDAGRTLGRAELIAAAVRGGDWLTRVQFGPPQAGWAQQYSKGGFPAPARAYEPAALASWESRRALEALLDLAEATGNPRFCTPVPDAVRWLTGVALRPGCWSRLYTIGANTPLYVSTDGRPVDEPASASPGYDWTGDFGIPALLARLDGSASVASVADARPVAGDARSCAGGAAAPGEPIVHGTRQMIAEASRIIATLEPAPPSPCPAQRPHVKARRLAGPRGR
jgi:hypothetical protein